MNSRFRSMTACAALTLPLILSACTSTGAVPSADARVTLEQANKAAVLGLYQNVYVKHDTSVIPQYVSISFVQHDPAFTDGQAGLIAGLKAQFAAAPSLTVDIKRVYTDGDIVVVHSLIRTTPDDRGTAAADIYQLAAGKVTTHWAVRQAVPATGANTNTMFSLPDGREPSNAVTPEQDNTRFVRQFDDTLFNKHDLSVIPAAVLERYIQHNPTFPDGRQGLIDGVTQTFKAVPQLSHDLKQVFADNDTVILYTNTHLSTGDRGLAIVDIYRLEGTKIAEHWDVIQPVPESSANINTMF